MRFFLLQLVRAMEIGFSGCVSFCLVGLKLVLAVAVQALTANSVNVKFNVQFTIPMN